MTKQKRLRGRLAVQQLPIYYFCYSKVFHWPNNLAPFFSQSEEAPPLSVKLQEQDIMLLVKRNVIGSFEPLRILIGQIRAFSHDVTATILVSKNNKTVAMLGFGNKSCGS